MARNSIVEASQLTELGYAGTVFGATVIHTKLILRSALFVARGCALVSNIEGFLIAEDRNRVSILFYALILT